MAADHRVKMCPNESCVQNGGKRRHRFKAEVQFCPSCGCKLVFVCKQCESRIQDLGPKHVKCDLCNAKSMDFSEKGKEVLIQGVKWAGTATTAALAASANKEIRNSADKVVKIVVKNGPKVVKTAVTLVLKKKL